MEPFSIILGRLAGMARGGLALLPQVAVALAILALTWLGARLAARGVALAVRRYRLRASLVELLQNLTAIGAWLAGLLVAATIAFPNMSPTDLLTAIGIGSVAIGFAFKDVFENFMAGILILFREPMRIGDYVVCEGIEGQVVHISIRDTHLRRVDGTLVVLPNAMLFKNPVRVETDLPKRRVRILVGVGYDADLDRARGVVERAFEGLETPIPGEPVQVFARDYAPFRIDFEVAWWTGSRPLDVRRSRDEVVRAIKRALDGAGIAIPPPQRVLTFKEPLALEGSAPLAQKHEPDEPSQAREDQDGQHGRVEHEPEAAASGFDEGGRRQEHDQDQDGGDHPDPEQGAPRRG